jgi:hypothetical protein
MNLHRANYTKEYNKKKYDVVHLKVPKGYKEKLKIISNINQMSMSALVCKWIDTHKTR